MFIVGFFAAAWVGASKIIAMQNNEHARLVTDNPYFYIALAAMIIGSQLFLGGFIAEMISRTSVDKNKYLIDCKINLERVLANEKY